MIETELNKVLNYMKQYVENIYEHDSEPMLNYKDLQLVLNEIERLNNIRNEVVDYITKQMKKYEGYDKDFEIVLSNIVVMLGGDK